MKIRSVSASQVALFMTCQRKWYFRYIEKIRFPQTAAQARGTLIHKQIENYLKHGRQPKDPILAKYVQAAVAATKRDGTPLLPNPSNHGKTHLVEHQFWLKLPGNLPPWQGFIDLLVKALPPEIGDFKTTSNVRYAKTVDELLQDPQMMSYAKFAYVEDHKGPLTLWHLVIEAKKRKGSIDPEVMNDANLAAMLAPPVRGLPRTIYTPITVEEEHVENRWQELIEVVNEMTTVAARCKSQDDFVPNTMRCGDYGGCEYRDQCGIIDVPISPDALFKKSREKKEQNKIMSSVLNRLMGKTETKTETKAETKKQLPQHLQDAKPNTVLHRLAQMAPETETAEPKKEMPSKLKMRLKQSQEKKASVPTGITPEDGTERTTPVAKKAVETETVETETVETAEPVKKTRKKRTPKTETVQGGFELYVDCVPVKRSGAEDQPVMFEDWVAPIIKELNESLNTQGIHNYLQLDYSNEKAAIITALNNHVDDLPSTMVISSSMLAAKEAMNVLIPHAARVVRALR